MEYRVKMFSCDQGGEFLNPRLAAFFREHGIRLVTTNAYTPEENCLVEKFNGKLLNKVRAIHEAANLPMCLWGEILHYVVHISATKALKGTTPFEKLKKNGHEQPESLGLRGVLLRSERKADEQIGHAS
jgi:transposase InsO family protein